MFHDLFRFSGEAAAAPVPSRPSAHGVPTEVPYLLIGAGTASFAAFRAIRAKSGIKYNRLTLAY